MSGVSFTSEKTVERTQFWMNLVDGQEFTISFVCDHRIHKTLISYLILDQNGNVLSEDCQMS